MYTRKNIPVKYNDVVVGDYLALPKVDPDTGTTSMVWYSFEIYAGIDRPSDYVIAHVQQYLVDTYPNMSLYDDTITEIVVPLIL